MATEVYRRGQKRLDHSMALRGQTKLIYKLDRPLFGLLIRGTHEGRSSSFVHHHTAGNLLFPPKTIPSCIIHYYIQTGTRLPRHLLSYYYLGN